MLVPIFTLKLNQKINPRMVTLGNYNGVNLSLTCGTTAGKVIIHNGQKRSTNTGPNLGSDADINVLNINQQVASVCAGQLDPTTDKDILVVGTQTNVLAYDVYNNTDLFYRDIADGANAVVIGHLGNKESPLAIVGGNCSLQGYDKDGEEKFWTVTGDNVWSLALTDYNNDGHNELLVGSDDYDIRVFREDEIIAEMTETDAVTDLCGMADMRFGYALANGTVGVYDKSTRFWRIKSKNQAVAIHSFDLNNDGVNELITGWSNGKIDARNDRTGEVIFKDNLPHPIAGIVEGDYVGQGKNQLICCTVEGEVRGYNPGVADARGNMMEVNIEQETIRDLSQRKQILQLELKNYEANTRTGGNATLSPSQQSSDLPTASSSDSTSSFTNQLSVTTETLQTSMGIIPADTQIHTTLNVNIGSETEQAHIELGITTTNETIIKSVIVFAEGIFPGESFVLHPNTASLSNSIRLPIVPPKDIPVDLHVKVFVGQKTSTQFHVFELMRQLPKFSMYAFCSPHTKLAPPTGSVTFHIKDRIQRVVLWINQNFLLGSELSCDEQLDLRLVALRSLKPLVISMENNGQITIRTDDMDAAGEIIQALALYLNISHLQTTADFPDDMEQLRQILSSVEEYNGVRQKLSAEMADHSNVIRSMIVRAEDSRILGDILNMKKAYGDLYDLNREIIASYKIRSANHEQLVSYLKLTNQFVQRAARLRVGKYQTQLVSACRAAIKSNNPASLVKIIKSGVA